MAAPAHRTQPGGRATQPTEAQTDDTTTREHENNQKEQRLVYGAGAQHMHATSSQEVSGSNIRIRSKEDIGESGGRGTADPSSGLDCSPVEPPVR